MNFCILWMLYYDLIDVSEGIDVNKTSASKECYVCYYWSFLNYSFKTHKYIYIYIYIYICIYTAYIKMVNKYAQRHKLF